jgi:hypothetical protein
MGTRNLTMVIDTEGKTRVAQYGQWDGYPSGNGVRILGTLTNTNSQKRLLSAVGGSNVRFINEADQKEIDLFRKSIGADGKWITMEQSDKIDKKYPYLSRNLGGGILDKIINSNGEDVILSDSTGFAADSLFCEWAYVVDFEKKVLEVYEGFNKGEVNGRFSDLEGRDGYNPVTLIKSYPLNDLPSKEVFLKDLEPDEEE